MSVKRNRMSPDVDRIFAKKLNRGLHESFPRHVQWAPDAASYFPAKNNHNVPYYKTGTVFVNAPELEEFAMRLEESLPMVPEEDRARIVFTKSGRCSKCNCMFNGRDGRPLRAACVVKCFCGQQELEAYCCVQCRFLQWMIQGCCSFTDTQVYEAETRPHQGFAPCPKKTCPCDTQTLDDFYKIYVTGQKKT